MGRENKRTNRQVDQIVIVIVIALGVGGRVCGWQCVYPTQSHFKWMTDCFEMGVSLKWKPHNQTLSQALASQKE